MATDAGEGLVFGLGKLIMGRGQVWQRRFRVGEDGRRPASIGRFGHGMAGRAKRIMIFEAGGSHEHDTAQDDQGKPYPDDEKRPTSGLLGRLA